MAVLYAPRQQRAIGELRARVPHGFRMVSEWASHTLSSIQQLGARMTQKRAETAAARGYIAYLLRLWRESGVGPGHWRASLQDPESGERIGFATLEQLFSYLRQQTADPSKGSGPGLG